MERGIKVCPRGHSTIVPNATKRCPECNIPYKPNPRFYVTMELVCDVETIKTLLSDYPNSKITTRPDN